MADKAMRLDPYAVRQTLYRGMVYFAQEDYEEAIVAMSEGLVLNQNFGALHQWLAATHGLLGNEVEARTAAAEVIRLSPNFADSLWRALLKNRSVLPRLMDGLRKAGLEIPDEPAAAD